MGKKNGHPFHTEFELFLIILGKSDEKMPYWLGLGDSFAILYIDVTYRTCAIINRGYYFFSLFCMPGYYSRAVINWVRLLLMDFFSDYTKPLYILRQTACTGTKKITF